NQAFLDILGYERDEVIGHTSLNLYIWADPLERQHFVEILQRDSKCLNFEAQVRRKNGELIWGLMSAAVMEFDNVPCIVVFVRDVTERKLEMQELHESEARFRNLFEKNSSVMLLIEPDSGEIVAANQSAINYYAFPPGQLVGNSINEINTLSPDSVALERQKALREEKNFFHFRHRLHS
ncbi:MAG: PAS domain S-box protein, partial [Deltaproteobacteria bacterium]|nr:PAS domain S-box protein [Deltaproteobacteria bacterium]